MRTTLEIDNDVLQAARELSKHHKKTIGAIISELARKALNAVPKDQASEPEVIYGFQPFPKDGKVVTNEMIDRLRQEDAY